MPLDIPDCRQRKDHACGPAAVESYLRFDGITPARWLARLSNPVQGMNPDTIEAVLRDAYSGRVLVGTMDPATLQYLTSRGRPVLCPITLNATGHWVVVSGVGRGRVYYQCPTFGPRRIKLADWLAVWRDSHGGRVYDAFGICTWPV